MSTYSGIDPDTIAIDEDKTAFLSATTHIERYGGIFIKKSFDINDNNCEADCFSKIMSLFVKIKSFFASLLDLKDAALTRLILVIGSIFLYVWDIGSDIYLAITYYRQEKLELFNCTLCILILSSLFTSIMSTVLWINSIGNDASSNCRVFRLKLILLPISSFLGLSMLYDYLQIVRIRFRLLPCCKRDNFDFSIADNFFHLTWRIQWLRMCETALETAPQLIMQLYLLTTSEIENTDKYFVVFKIITSFSSVMFVGYNILQFYEDEVYIKLYRQYRIKSINEIIKILKEDILELEKQNISKEQFDQKKELNDTLKSLEETKLKLRYQEITNLIREEEFVKLKLNEQKIADGTACKTISYTGRALLLISQILWLIHRLLVILMLTLIFNWNTFMIVFGGTHFVLMFVWQFLQLRQKTHREYAFVGFLRELQALELSVFPLAMLHSYTIINLKIGVSRGRYLFYYVLCGIEMFLTYAFALHKYGICKYTGINLKCEFYKEKGVNKDEINITSYLIIGFAVCSFICYLFSIGLISIYYKYIHYHKDRINLKGVPHRYLLNNQCYVIGITYIKAGNLHHNGFFYIKDNIWKAESIINIANDRNCRISY